MPNIRFIAAGAVVLLVSGLAAGSAAAQTATDGTPGKPLQLLKIVEQSNRPKRYVAPYQDGSGEKFQDPCRQGRAQAAARASADGGSACARKRVAAGQFLCGNEQSRRPNRRRRPSSLQHPPPFAPSDLVVGGQTVPIASPDTVNQIDLAASDADPHASTGALGQRGSKHFGAERRRGADDEIRRDKFRVGAAARKLCRQHLLVTAGVRRAWRRGRGRFRRLVSDRLRAAADLRVSGKSAFGDHLAANGA